MSFLFFNCKYIFTHILDWMYLFCFGMTIVASRAKDYVKLKQYVEVYIMDVYNTVGVFLFSYVGSSAVVSKTNRPGRRARQHDRDIPRRVWVLRQTIQIIPMPGFSGKACAMFAEMWITIYYKIVLGHYSQVRGSYWCKRIDQDTSYFSTAKTLQYLGALLFHNLSPTPLVEVVEGEFVPLTQMLHPVPNHTTPSTCCFRCLYPYGPDHPQDWTACEAVRDIRNNRIRIPLESKHFCIIPSFMY